MLSLWREGEDDFFEARIAAKWIPLREKLQFAVSDAAWNLRSDRQLFERQILLAGPGVDHSQTDDIGRTVDRIFCNRQQFAGATAFANRVFFSAESGVDEAEPA